MVLLMPPVRSKAAVPLIMSLQIASSTHHTLGAESSNMAECMSSFDKMRPGDRLTRFSDRLTPQ